MEVEWHVASDCSNIFIDTMWLEGLHITNATYWYQAQYDNSLNGFRCPPDYFIQNNQWSQLSVNSTGPKGYDAVWGLAFLQDPCIFGPGIDDTIAYGPLN
jgi:hypothetical protein